MTVSYVLSLRRECHVPGTVVVVGRYLFDVPWQRINFDLIAIRGRRSSSIAVAQTPRVQFVADNLVKCSHATFEVCWLVGWLVGVKRCSHSKMAISCLTDANIM